MNGDRFKIEKYNNEEIRKKNRLKRNINRMKVSGAGVKNLQKIIINGI